MKKKGLLFSSLMAIAIGVHAQNVGTVAGTPGSAGWSATTVSIASAELHTPTGLMVDSYDRIWFTESGASHRIRVVDFGTGNVLNKTGYFGDPNNSGNFGYINQSGNVARYDSPRGLTMASDGKIYIADFNNHAIRGNTAVGSNIGQTQIVSTFAGEAPPQGFGDHNDGTGTAARFNRPIDIITDASGNMFVADNYNEVIRKITPGGAVTTIAGGVGLAGDVDGTGTNARFSNVTSLAVLDANHIVVCDSWNNKIKKLNTSTGEVTTIAGEGSMGHEDGAVATAKFRYPTGVVVDKFGDIYVSEGGDGQSNCIRKIDMTNNTVSTIAGTYNTVGTTDGVGNDARFNRPMNMAFNTDGSVLYVADQGNHTIRSIDFNPEADFIASPTSTQVNVPVQLTDQSTGATSWTWDITPSDYTFVNGTNANSQNPEVEFTQTGSYTVTLTATNDFGSDDVVKSNYINISDINTNDPPIADFKASDTVGNAGDIIKFTDLSINTPSQWLWTIVPSTHQYVNSTSNASQNPEVQFTAQGAYTIILKATNANGDDSKAKSGYIKIGPVGIEQMDLSDVVKVYPNPTQGTIYIEATDNFQLEGLGITLYDFSGRAVYQKQQVNLDGKMQIPALSTGVYLLEMTDGTSVVKKKIVVQ